MVRAYLGILPLAVLILPLAACDEADPTPPSTAEGFHGRWLGTIAGVTLALVATEEGSSLHGDGAFYHSATSVALTFTGTRTDAMISLTIDADVHGNMVLAGELNEAGDSAFVLLTGAGFDTFPIRLGRIDIVEEAP